MGVSIATLRLDMHTSIEMFGLTPHERRAELGLNGKTAPTTKPPLEHGTKEPIEGVVLRLVLQVVLQPGVAFNRDDRTNAKLPWNQLFAAGHAVCHGWHRRSRCRQTGQGNRDPVACTHRMAPHCCCSAAAAC